MAINLRNKVKGYGDEIAGNYETALIFTTGDFETPNEIRKTFQNNNQRKGKRDGTNELPSNWTRCFGARLCIITNWSTFYHDI